MAFKKFLSKAKDIDVLASLPDGVVLVSGSGKIEWINDNACLLLGVSKNDALKQNINDLVESGLDLARQAAISSKLVVGRSKLAFGRDMYMEISAKAADDFLVMTLRDVTQNYKTVTNIMVEHESSKKVNNDKNAFLVKLSNELKSPLHSVIGFSQAMADGLGGKMSEKQEKYIKIINKNSSEMLYMFDKILEMAKTESNLFEYEYQIFDVVNTIQAVLKGYESELKDKNLNLNFEYSDIAKRTVYFDENALKVILQNVMDTSISSTDIGSISVKITYPDLELVSQQVIDVSEGATDKSYMLISITDTGAGIPESDLVVIFDPYVQLDRSNKKNIVKSIALASAKNLLRYLKGSIWVESQPMQGTTYNIIMPVERVR